MLFSRGKILLTLPFNLGGKFRVQGERILNDLVLGLKLGLLLHLNVLLLLRLWLLIEEVIVVGWENGLLPYSVAVDQAVLVFSGHFWLNLNGRNIFLLYLSFGLSLL